LTFFEQIKGMNKGESYLEAVRRGGPNRGKGKRTQKNSANIHRGALAEIVL
jgi:hypothetical protein